MRELSTSASTYYKSRAGTTYLVANRLIEFGYLDQSQAADSGEKLISVSDAGVEAHRSWLTPPIPMQAVAHSADLIRLRFFFLGILDHETRLAFIDDAIAGLQVHLKRCEDLIPQNEALGDQFGALATISVVLETKARIEWLQIVRKKVVNMEFVAR